MLKRPWNRHVMFLERVSAFTKAFLNMASLEDSRVYGGDSLSARMSSSLEEKRRALNLMSSCWT